MLAIALTSVAVDLGTSGGARSEGASAPRSTATAAADAVEAAGSVHANTMNKAATGTAKKDSASVAAAALSPATPTSTPPTPTPTPTPTPSRRTVPTPTTMPTVQVAVPAPAPPAVIPVAEPALATLVAQVEASGIDPGSNWSWSMGDTATHCAAMSGAGTGCTYGTAGQEFTVFAGSPNLALVAHEVANAETQNDAVPTLMNAVATAEDGTSWSPTDAVASCLVENFMGFQDDAAGTWQCSATLGAEVAANIHDGT